MRYVIYGAGAVGGVIGARLHRAGCEVVLIARGAHLAAIRARGLTLVTPEGSETLAVDAVGSPAEVGIRAGDAVILGMKTQDTEAALAALLAAAGSEVPVFCTQNGVENERLAARRFAHVYGMVVMLPATHLEPGVVEQNSAPIAGILDTGCYPGGTDDTAAAVCADLERAGFSARPDPALMRQKYAKLLMNLGNAFQVVCGPGADARAVVGAARAEGEACLRAAGIAFASDEEFRARRGDLIQLRPGGGARRQGGSSWQSVVRGTGTVEADWLNGEVCLLGRLHGVPTPVNRLLQEEANRVARERLAPGAVGEAELRARLGLAADR